MKMADVLNGLRFLAVVYFAISTASSHFHCDTPEEWLQNADSIAPGEQWPNGTVIYQLDSSLVPDDILEVHKAFHDIQSKTCIRFRARDPSESAYVNIEHDDTVCGMAHTCFQGEPQYAKFGSTCLNANTMIHELGHTLCFGHEQTRVDRDEYLSFKTCKPYQIPNRDEYETRGHLYDYASQMHYQCGWCLGGWPNMAGVPGCGNDVQDGLSVLDSDKINDLYDCQGCFRHRWKRTDNLTEEDRASLVSFGETSEGLPLYLCRAYVDGGEVAPGKYRLEEDVCYVPINGVVQVTKNKVQVFTDPQRGASNSVEYKALRREASEDHFTHVGRTPFGGSIYAAVATIEVSGSWERAIGKVYGDNLTHAYIPFLNQEFVLTQFDIVGCD